MAALRAIMLVHGFSIELMEDLLKAPQLDISTKHRISEFVNSAPFRTFYKHGTVSIFNQPRHQWVNVLDAEALGCRSIARLGFPLIRRVRSWCRAVQSRSLGKLGGSPGSDALAVRASKKLRSDNEVARPESPTQEVLGATAMRDIDGKASSRSRSRTLSAARRSRSVSSPPGADAKSRRLMALLAPGFRKHINGRY
jgi:hypothetical protein